jgi:hypothetical protein
LAIARGGIVRGTTNAWEDGVNMRLEKWFGNAGDESRPGTINLYCHELSIRSEIKQLSTIATSLWLRSSHGGYLPLAA